ncbi:MAG: DUF4364 family protein [Eubacterium sp.]|nr:DUF4364 family protein [Eubacterium sp.]
MLNSKHQVEDKLIILYVLDKIKTGITREQIALIILENIQMGYFDVQLYLDSLMDEEYIRLYTLEDGKQVVTITAQGQEALKILKHQIPAYTIEMLDLYIDQNRDRIFKEVKVTGDYVKNNDGDYQVQLRLHENNIVLMELSINTPSKSQSQLLVDNWKKDTQNLYTSIIKVLTQKK